MSHQWLHSCRVVHTIHKLCERDAAINPDATNGHRDMQWLLDTYSEEFEKSQRAGVVTGAIPNDREVLHHLALVRHYALYLAGKGGSAMPVKKSEWQRICDAVDEHHEENPNSMWGRWSEDQVEAIGDEQGAE